MRMLGAGVLLLLSATTAQAAGLSASLSFVSDYRFRGISQSDRHAVPQLELDYDTSDGWEVGAFASPVDYNDHEHTSAEVDLYASKEFRHRQTTFSFQVYYYGYPNHRPPKGGRRYSAVEGIASATRTFGKFDLTASVAMSPDYADQSGRSEYVALGATYRAVRHVTFSANVGRLRVRSWDRLPGSGYPYTHWDAGATFNWRRWSLDLRALGTSLSRRECGLIEGGQGWCGAAAVASVTYRFDQGY